MIRQGLKLTVKGGILGGAGYFAYNSGLFSTDLDETIANFEKIKKEYPTYLDKAPPVVQDICKSTKDYAGSGLEAVSNSVVKPVKDSWTGFKNDWLDFDMEWTKGYRSEDGIIKPAWNKAVVFIFETIADSPEIVKNLSMKAWNKINDITSSNTESTIVIESTITKPNSEPKSQSTSSGIQQK